MGFFFFSNLKALSALCAHGPGARTGRRRRRNWLQCMNGSAGRGQPEPGPRPRPRPRFVRGRGRGVRPRFARARGRGLRSDAPLPPSPSPICPESGTLPRPRPRFAEIGDQAVVLEYPKGVHWQVASLAPDREGHEGLNGCVPSRWGHTGPPTSLRECSVQSYNEDSDAIHESASKKENANLKMAL
jgi:hypothetical protein